MAKFCTQCGAKLDDDDLFCGVCGVSLVKQDADDHSAEKCEPSAETPEYEPVINQTTTASQNNKMKPSVIALIAVVVVVVALIICIMPKGSKNAVDYFDPSAHQSEGPASNKKGLSDTEVQTIAKKLNEEINFFGDTSDAYNLSYSGFKIESDNYNRYIVCMHYQYEDAKRNYHNGDVIVYFRYDPETDQYYYKRTNIKFPMKSLSEEYLINSIKEDTEFGWGTDPDNPVVDNKENESPEVNTPSANVSSDWGQAYFDVVADAMKEFPQYQYSCSYSVFDIDKDGTPELFLKVGTCEADYQLKLYRYANGTADCFATLWASHAVFCGLGDQKAFLIDSGRQGYEVVTKYSYANGELNEEILFEGAVQNYHEFSYLTSFELDDLSGLEWTANEPDNNQSVLDNYSFENNVVAEAEITSDNFEQVVPLNKRNDWYDNGIFSSYFASCDHQSNVTWEYIGTTPDSFGLSYYDYTEVDVFRVDFPDGWKTYLFVPYNENIGNPPVVFLFFDSNEVPMEIWNGSY